jgi:hypothetical protein
MFETFFTTIIIQQIMLEKRAEMYVSQCKVFVKVVQSKGKFKCLTVFLKFSNIKFHKNTAIGFQVVLCIKMERWGQMDGWMDGLGELIQ